MDLDEPRTRTLFFELHSGLPQEGPGNQASTARALGFAQPLPQDANVLDIACGPGRQTLDLADLLPHATITAIDSHPPFVEEANRCFAARDLAGRVTARLGDMQELDLPPASFDLIWCEGAAYIMGVEHALRAWRTLLKPGGRLALSDAVWLRPDPPDPVRRSWDEYPAMTDSAGCRERVRTGGYDLLGDFVLPQEAWWDYYKPQEQRLPELVERYAGDPSAQALLAAFQAEIDTYRDFGAYYGYLFLVMALPSGPLSRD